MSLQYDRQIVISVGKSRKDMNWLPQTMTVSELYARFDNPVRGVETLVNYLKLKKSQQDDLKDVGGYVAGSLSGPRRKASAVTGTLTHILEGLPTDCSICALKDICDEVEGMKELHFGVGDKSAKH